MKLKKTTIDNQIVYVEIKDEDIKDDMLNTDDDIIDVDPIDGSNNFFKRIGAAANKAASKVSQAFSKASNNVKESFRTTKEEYDRKQKANDKNKKLAKILPFLDEESIHELVEKILNDDESTKDLDLVKIFPFLTSEDAGKVLVRALKDGNTNVNIERLAPFVSKEALREVVDMYINGELDDSITFESLLPFLDNDSIKKIFEYEILNKKPNNN